MKTLLHVVLIIPLLLVSTMLECRFIKKNCISPRLQWNSDDGYCGEVSLISAGLYYGQYISQYDARTLAIGNKPQNKGQLLLGENDYVAATKMHLQTTLWPTNTEHSTDQFLMWVKHNVAKGYPVALGVYTNEYLFYGTTSPKAGDPTYDHIVLVTGFSSSHPLTKAHYYKDDCIYFSDHGLWGNAKNPPYIFKYPCGSFQKNRVRANAQQGSIYSLPNTIQNYGIAITGIIDDHKDTVPVRLTTNVNYEKPSIKNGSPKRPSPMPLTLTITLSHLELYVPYNVYRYNTLASVPHSHFNAQAHKAYETWHITVTTQTSYRMTIHIMSDEIAVFRAVKASAP